MSFTKEIHELDPVRRELRITVDADKTQESVKRVTRQIARHAKLPGFRPGKAPLTLVKSHYKDVLRREVIEALVQETIRPALEELDVDPVHVGEIRDVDLPEEGPLAYTAYYEVAPEIELGDYKGIEVEQIDPAVTDQEVEERVQALADSHAALEPVEREAVQEGDYVLCDFIQTPLEEGEEPRIDEDVFLKAGDENHFEELNEALLSGKVGETVSFEVNYEDSHPDARMAGKAVTYRVRIKGLKEKVLPELTDEFIDENTDSESLEAFRAKLQEDLGRFKKESAERGTREQIISKLLESHEFLAPPSLTREQAQSSLRSQIRDLVERGMDPRTLSVDWDEEFRRHLGLAERHIRAHFLLEKIGEAENISVDESEVSAEIEKFAEVQKSSADEIREELESSGGVSALKERLLRRKILDFLMESARISNVEE